LILAKAKEKTAGRHARGSGHPGGAGSVRYNPNPPWIPAFRGMTVNDVRFYCFSNGQ
jgi:hypothetical protein